MRELKKELWPIKVRLIVEQLLYERINYQHDPKSDLIEEWLGRNVGTFKDQWNVIYSSRYADYYFRNSETATFFSLKWT